MEYKRVNRTLVSNGTIIDIYKDRMLITDEEKGLRIEEDWDFINHKGAAAVIAEDSDGNILMVRQYRNSIDAHTLEIPAGGLNPNEDMAACAARELEEETGYRTEKVSHLMDFIATVAYSNEMIGIYYADKLIKSAQNLDEDEYVEVEKYPLDDLVQMVYEGKIVDGKSIAAIMAYKVLKEKKE